MMNLGIKSFIKLFLIERKSQISSTKQHYYPEPSNWTYKEIKFKPMDRL